MGQAGEVTEIIPVYPPFHPESNKYFFKRGIARTFPNAVDCGMELERSGLGSSYRICNGTAHIVVTVGAERAVYSPDQLGHDPVHLGRYQAPDRIGETEQDSPVVCCPL